MSGLRYCLWRISSVRLGISSVRLALLLMEDQQCQAWDQQCQACVIAYYREPSKKLAGCGIPGQNVTQLLNYRPNTSRNPDSIFCSSGFRNLST